MRGLKDGNPTSISSPGCPDRERGVMGSLRIWILAIRPRTLPAAVVPVLVATALAWRLGTWSLWPALAALVGALALQIGCNTANDYFDWKSGADGPDRLGPTRVTSAGLATPRQVVGATVFAFVLATAVGLYLAWVGGWPIVAIGLCSIVAAIAYTGGPYPLGYNGLGELTSFIFFGPVAVLGTFYLHTGHLDPLAAWLSVPVGAWVAAILVVNNLRDIPTDRRAGKRTFSVRFGARATRGLYAGLIAAGFLAPLALWPAGYAAAACAPLLALPLALSPLRAVFSEPDGPRLNAALAGTARLLLVGGIFLVGGLLWL
jgi:1,4-dihydroxy-2-naphthoate octaprenyltransferase